MSDLTGQSQAARVDDQTKKPFHARRSFRIFGAIVVLAAIGAGSFAIAATVTSSPTPTVSFAPSNTVPTIGRGPAGGGQRLSGATVGTVESVQPNSFMLKSQTGTTVKVDVSSATTFHEQGKTTAKFSDISPGSAVAVAGKSSGSDLTATSVTILPTGGAFGGGAGGPGGGFRGRGNVGTVQSVGSQTFVMSSRTGQSLTVKISASTQFTDRSVSNASIKTVKVGDLVIVAGTTSGNTITATSVVIVPAGGGFGGGGFGAGGGRGFGGGFGGRSSGAAAPN